MLRPQPLPPVPAETARLARAVFPLGHPYLQAADELGEALSDEAFAALFPQRGRSALAGACCTVETLFRTTASVLCCSALGSRRVYLARCTTNPTIAWVVQACGGSPRASIAQTSSPSCG